MLDDFDLSKEGGSKLLNCLRLIWCAPDEKILLLENVI